jgi:hypothetical protein
MFKAHFIIFEPKPGVLIENLLQILHTTLIVACLLWKLRSIERNWNKASVEHLETVQSEMEFRNLYEYKSNEE